MPRKKIGVSSWGCSLPATVKVELKEMLTKLGCVYAGRPSLGAFLQQIASGDLEVRKKIQVGVDKDNSAKLS